MNPLPTLPHLLLVRLLVPLGKRPSRMLLRRSLQPLLADHFSPSEWTTRCDDALGSLIEADLATSQPLGLTGRGRELALGFLGLADLPAGLSWKQLRDRYLIGIALGVSSEQATRERLADPETLRIHILRKK